MTAKKAVADLLRTDLMWRRFFKRCCELGAFCLRAQAWQFRVGLAERGVRVDLGGTQDALLVIAGKTLPDTLAGRAAAGVSNWRDHPLGCECQDCSATMSRHVRVTPCIGGDATEIPTERETESAADAKLAATGVIQTERQAFTVAHEHFGRDERGGVA